MDLGDPKTALNYRQSKSAVAACECECVRVCEGKVTKWV